jgi:hypothetical protein
MNVIISLTQQEMRNTLNLITPHFKYSRGFEVGPCISLLEYVVTCFYLIATGSSNSS